MKPAVPAGPEIRVGENLRQNLGLQPLRTRAIAKIWPFYLTVLRFVGIGGPIRIYGIIGLFDSRFKT